MLADMSWLTRLGFVADAQGRRADEAALLARVLRGDAQALALLYRCSILTIRKTPPATPT